MKRKSDFENAVAKLIRMNLTFHNLNKMAEEELGLSLVQYHLLRTLRDMPGNAPQRVAHAAGMHPSTLTQSIKRLSRRGLIFVEEDPRDSRKKILGVTFEGSTAILKFEKGIDRFLPHGSSEDWIQERAATQSSGCTHSAGPLAPRGRLDLNLRS